MIGIIAYSDSIQLNLESIGNEIEDRMQIKVLSQNKLNRIERRKKIKPPGQFTLHSKLGQYCKNLEVDLFSYSKETERPAVRLHHPQRHDRRGVDTVITPPITPPDRTESKAVIIQHVMNRAVETGRRFVPSAPRL